MTGRAALVLPSGPDVWRVAHLTTGFTRVAGELARGGFAVELIVPPGGQAPAPPKDAGVHLTHLTFTAPPIVAGPAPAHLSTSLRIGHQLWRHLAADPPDIVFAPLAGGVLQPALMSRAVGESLTGAAMVLWGEATTAERLRLGDIEPAGVGALVDDALETTALRLADAVAGPGPADGGATRLQLALPADGPAAPAAHAADGIIDEIVFVGPGSGRHGAPEFLTAIERMGHAGRLEGRRVTFLGPWREGPDGLGKAMLGRRARDWPFAFTQIDESRPDAVLAHLRRPGVLAVFAGAAPDDDSLLADAIQSGVSAAVSARHPLAGRLGGGARPCAPDLSDLESLLAPCAPVPLPPASDWAGAFEVLIERRSARPARPPTEPKPASLCITHRDRPAALAAALHSRGGAAGRGLDTVVVDTGSTPENLERIAALEAEDVRIFGKPPGTRQAWARNLAADHAAGEILIFLDDDNLFIDEGLSRLIGAFSDTEVDVVVSTLSLYDSSPGQGDAEADLVFMGETGLAGLLFNGFGDANFAIRRDRFLEMGGFADNDVAAFDWVFLASAQARGLKFGVLQRPAIGYQRDLGARDTKWRKLDLEGPRRHVLGAYASGGLPTLILGLAQSLSMPVVE